MIQTVLKKSPQTPASPPGTSPPTPRTTPRTNHFTCGVTCSGGRIIQLTLDSQGYAGKLTPLVSHLTQLITLDLTDNSFYGPIPTSISSLCNLKSLILRLNSFSGATPLSITALKSLEYLDLSRNSLYGSLPSMNSLAGLTRLDLSYNNLTGSLPELPPNLNELAMKSGSLIKSPFNWLNRLMTLELSETRSPEPSIPGFSQFLPGSKSIYPTASPASLFQTLRTASSLPSI